MDASEKIRIANTIWAINHKVLTNQQLRNDFNTIYRSMGKTVNEMNNYDENDQQQFCVNTIECIDSGFSLYVDNCIETCLTHNGVTLMC